MDRRSFLKVAAAAPCIFGLRQLLAQEVPAERPEYFRDALLRMKELDQPAIVLVVPGSARERTLMAAALYKRLTGDSALVRQLLTGAVFICLPAGIIPVPPEDKSNRLLLDPDGRRIGGDVITIETIEDPAKFVESFGRFLNGDSGERLEVRARKALESASPQTRQALKDLESDEVSMREKATAILLRDAAKLQPALVLSLRSGEASETSLRIKGILEQLYLDRSEKDPGPRLPFGTKIKIVTGVVGDSSRDPCPGCGMSVMTRKSEKFLRFLAHPDD